MICRVVLLIYEVKSRRTKENIMCSKLSSNGQVTIPKKVRESLGLVPGDLVIYEISGDDSVVLRRAKSNKADFNLATSDLFDEWASNEDEKAFSTL